MKSIAEHSLDLTGLFEAEIFVWLLLKTWNHPLANDRDFANDLLENAAIALRAACEGEQFIEGLPAADFNFIAAVWYVEHCASESTEADPQNIEARRAWRESVRRTLPSCFCNPSDLG
jgi:hypothetical protein